MTTTQLKQVYETYIKCVKENNDKADNEQRTNSIQNAKSS